MNKGLTIGILIATAVLIAGLIFWNVTNTKAPIKDATNPVASVLGVDVKGK